MLTNRRNYLDSLNFATNLVLFREGGGHHTRLATAIYWSAYGAKAPSAWCCLMDEDGRALAEWSAALPGDTASVVGSEERRVGEGCGRTGRCCRSRYHKKK